MTDDSLLTGKQPDNFTTESPIRAFTDFQVAGQVAIGKGFRPSMAHLARYLDAMLAKEGWEFVQVLLPENGASDPTIMFRKRTPPMIEMSFDGDRAEANALAAYNGTGTPTGEAYRNFFKPVKGEDVDPRPITKRRALGEPYGSEVISGWEWTKPGSRLAIPEDHRARMIAHVAARLGVGAVRLANEYERTASYLNGSPVLEAMRLCRCDSLRRESLRNIKQALDDYRASCRPAAIPRLHPDDPIRPAYYDGVACCEIIDSMPTNVGLALKYMWRLGEKDPIEQEIGKAIFYLKRQIELGEQENLLYHGYVDEYRRMARDRINARFVEPLTFAAERATIATLLVRYTTTGEPDKLSAAVREMERMLDPSNGITTGLAV